MYPLISSILKPLITPLVSTFAGTAIKKIVGSLVSDEVVKQALKAAEEQSKEIIANIRKSVLIAIVWQNVLLISSIGASFYFHSYYPFYLGYATIILYSLYSSVKHYDYIKKIWITKKPYEVLKGEILIEIKSSIAQRPIFQRIIIEKLGPGLEELSETVSQKIYPELKIAFYEITILLLLSLIIFRFLLIPYLSHFI